MYKSLTAAALLSALLFPLTAAAQEQAPADKPAITIIAPDGKSKIHIVDVQVTPLGEAGAAHNRHQPSQIAFNNGEQGDIRVVWNTSKQTSKIEATYLGVSCQPLELEAGEVSGLPRGTGLRVNRVVKESPADAAGLQAGDLLLRLNEQLLVNTEQLVALIRTFDADEKVTLHFIRSGKKQSVQAALTTRKVAQIGPGGQPANAGKPIQSNRSQANEGISFNIARILKNADGKMLKLSIGREKHLGQPGQAAEELEIDLAGMMQDKGVDGALSPTLVWKTRDQQVTIAMLYEGKAIKAVDEDGKILYEGAVRDDANYPGLPDEVKKMLKDSTKDGKLIVGQSQNEIKLEFTKPAE